MSLIQNKTKVKRIIQLLSQWAKKPSLDQDISRILDEYYSLIINGEHNFSETSVIIRDYTTIYEKKVSILHKELFALSFRLCEVLRPPEPEPTTTVVVAPTDNNNTEQVSQTQNEPSQSSEITTITQTTIVSTTAAIVDFRKKKAKVKPTENTENSVQIPISNFPPEILESLNINNCNVEEIISTCREKLTPNDPLYSVFVKNSNEINRKNTIIRKGIELRENSWFQFQFLEVHLEKNCVNNNVVEENHSENIDSCSGYHSMTTVVSDNESNTQCTTRTAEITESGIELNSQVKCTDAEDMCTEEGLVSSEDVQTSTNDINNVLCNDSSLTNNGTLDTSISENINTIDNDEELKKRASIKYNTVFREVKIKLISLPNNISLAQSDSIQSLNGTLSKSEMRNIIVNKLEVDLTNLNVNLFKFSNNILSRVDYFKLSNKYLEWVRF